MKKATIRVSGFLVVLINSIFYYATLYIIDRHH